LDTALRKLSENSYFEDVDDVRLRVNPDVLNLDHLSQYTCGDGALEQELLVLFKDQAVLQFANIEQAQGEAEWVMAVHTIKGSARGIGATHVAERSGELEKLGFYGEPTAKQALTHSLKQAVATCVMTIKALIQSNLPTS